jgi:hypothetical protein
MSYRISPTSQCRCSSGKLYRDCCSRLTKLPKNASPELRRRYWGKLVDECVTSILDYLYDKEVLADIRDEAGEYLLQGFSQEVDLEEFRALWDAYTLFHYPLDLPGEEGLEDPDDEDEDIEALPAAILYALQDDKLVWSKGHRNEVFKELLESHFSWYRVVEVMPRVGMRLQDIILDQEVVVADVSASLSAEKGWIICAKVLQFDGISLLHGLGTYPLPANSFPMMHELSAKLRESAESEFNRAIDRASVAVLSQVVVNSYVRAVTDVRDSVAPEVRNTDGDPMEPVVIRYAVHDASVAQVVERIQDALGNTGDGPGEEVEERDESGAPSKVIVPFVRPPAHATMMDVVLVARFIVESQEVAVEVNSVNRATEMKQLVNERLGDILSFIGEESKTLESLMSGQHPGQISEQEMTPETREALDRHMREMQEKWLTQPIPALKGMTPREAAEAPEGRVLLEALLDDFAARQAKANLSASGLSTFDVEELRARLGMKHLD